MPHPPIIIPEVGKGEEKKISKTTRACAEVAKEIKRIAPDVIVVITPHGLMFRDAISGTYDLTLAGSLFRFGTGKVALKKEIDLEAVEKIAELSDAEAIPFVKLDEKTARRYQRINELDRQPDAAVFWKRNTANTSLSTSHTGCFRIWNFSNSECWSRMLSTP